MTAHVSPRDPQAQEKTVAPSKRDYRNHTRLGVGEFRFMRFVPPLTFPLSLHSLIYAGIPILASMKHIYSLLVLPVIRLYMNICTRRGCMFIKSTFFSPRG
jgi:hypothetical protein